MIPAEIIKLKRNGFELSEKVIQEFIKGYVEDSIADYQMSALLMAIYFQGMTKKETFALTSAMLHTGLVIDLSDISGMKIDKHSTGGVGDKTSIVIGPIVAAAGVKVPMISGRGLGHTGGTLDKLESIPGFNTQLSLSEFKKLVNEHGVCFIGQTKEICPADKKMYSLRDVTGTVECIPLICASIMSKKLAEGIDGLVLDVKVGQGAFMKNKNEAQKLAQGLIEIAKLGGKSVTALLTDMNQPLGYAVGNALEVKECLEVLDNKGPDDLRELCLELSAHMILLGKKAKNISQAKKIAEELLVSGRAKKVFVDIVKAQGGRFTLPTADKTQTLNSLKNGVVKKLDAGKVGLASLTLGAGRKRSEDTIDMAAGIILHKKIGDKVKKGEPLATLHYSNKLPTTSLNESLNYLKDAYEFSLQKSSPPRLIIKVMTTQGSKK
ncbi:MAG: thymidine phosphorylase [Oligoflexia bacterium]|nr:thymidine phosphorylase [Oligoflexia bacterium]